MVRRKSRWLLVRFDFEGDILTSSCANDRGDEAVRSDAASSSASSTTSGGKKRGQSRGASVGASNADDEATTAIDKERSSIRQVTGTDVYRSIRDSMMQNYGVIGASLADVQVRLYDPILRLGIIKTNRDNCNNVRSSLILMTNIKQGGDVLKVATSTLSVCGSARTARNAAWDEVHRRFGRDVVMMKDRRGDEPWTKRTRIALEKGLMELEGRLDKIDSAC
jgi:RNase P/RNase MRP subunit POP5